MAGEQKKQVPLRLSAKLYDAIAAWAEDDFRSVNGQIAMCIRDRVSAETFDALQSKLRVNGKIMLSLTRGDTNYAVELSSNTYTAVSVEGRMAGTVGILRIRNFDSETPAQFKTAYRSLLDQGAASLLFDLRDNEGGSLEAAKEVVAFLMPRGPYAKRCV